MATDPATIAEARELLLEYGRFVADGAAHFCFGTLEKEAARLPLSYIEQGGGCLIAHVDRQPAGFIAWRALPAESTLPADDMAQYAWEMKRLWVRPIGRGLSLGRALTQAVLDRAVAAGRKAVYLDTVPSVMSAAHQLYLSVGFTPCEAYNNSPLDGIAYLVKYL